MVTISVLMGIGGTEPMLNSRMNLSLNVGISPEQLHSMIQTVEVNVSKENADAAKIALNELLQAKGLKTEAKVPRHQRSENRKSILPKPFL